MSVWTDLMGAEIKYYQGKYRTRVAEAGQGEPLILIHGTGGHMEAYSRNVMRLAQNFRVLAMDLIWHGFSQTEPHDVNTLPTQAAQVVDLMDAAGIDRAHIEGESLGGWIAMWVALNYPDRVRKIVLNTTAGVKWDPGDIQEDTAGGLEALAARSMQAIQDPNMETIRKRLEWLVASPDRVTDELVDIRHKIYNDPAHNKSLEHVFLQSFVTGKQLEFLVPKADMAKIKAPTLVFWTEKNPGTGPEVGEKIASLIPGSKYYCMLDAAHWPQWEHPEEHDRVITAFLKDGD